MRFEGSTSSDSHPFGAGPPSPIPGDVPRLSIPSREEANNYRFSSDQPAGPPPRILRPPTAEAPLLVEPPAAVAETPRAPEATVTFDRIARRELPLMLVDPDGPMRSVVRTEDRRVDELLDDPTAQSAADKSKIAAMGQGLRAKMGPGTIKPHHTDTRLEAEVNAKLDETRTALRAGVMRRMDDVPVDDYLGIGGGQSIVPPLFRRLHQEVEQREGREISFIEWASDHASNEQLVNVMQWHDHYLTGHDASPDFQEKGAGVKDDYVQSSQAAVAAGELDGAMALSPGSAAGITIRHGSPLSPATATTHAEAYPDRNEILVRPLVDEKALFHELGHVASPGFMPLFAEGFNERLVATIYGHARPDSPPYDLENSVYRNQLDTLASLERLTEGQLTLLELSRMAAGPDRTRNTAKLVMAVDNKLGMPVLISSLRRVTSVAQAAQAHLHKDEATQAAYSTMRDMVSLFEHAFVDEEGRVVRHTVPSLLGALAAPQIMRTHRLESVLNALTVIRYIDEEQQGTIPD